MRRNKTRVLLIEDDEDDYILMNELLEDLGTGDYELQWESTAESGLMALQQGEFDVCLVDYRIGGRTGLEVICLANEQDSTVPMIIMTGARDYEIDVAAMRAGAADFLEKGELTPRLLERSIRYATRRAKDMAALEEARRLLADAKRELESKVQERTKELVSANETLKHEMAERERAEERLRHQAFHDRLTSLPNRELLADRLDHAIRRASRTPEKGFAVLLANIDRFRNVNDSLGHQAGDEFLKAIGNRFAQAVRPGDTVARFSGDDFAILLEDISLPDSAIGCAKRLQEVLGQAIMIDAREIYCTVSVGIAVSSLGYVNAESMLQDAVSALNMAKRNGGGRHELFDVAMRDSSSGQLQIESELRRAIERGGEFELFYQPIVEMSGGRIFGFESLIRWRHPEQGLLSPIKFVPVAEETGMIVPIGKWVIGEAAEQLATWERQYPERGPLSMAVNISARQLIAEDFIGDVRDTLGSTGVEPSRLKIEITESFLIGDPENAAAVLRELKGLGLSLAIDDFGTGYSSLSYLRRYPFDVLKIDRSFVRALAERAEDLEIVRSVMALAGVLGMDVVAEGAETVREVSLLEDLGCQLVQGFYYSPPLQRADAEALLACSEVRWQGEPDRQQVRALTG